MIAACDDDGKAKDRANASGKNHAAVARAATRPARTKPVALRDSRAAARVSGANWEPRPRNRRANRNKTNGWMLKKFRRHSALPRKYKRRVTGRYSGTTDEILQWAAHKWGFSPDLLRGVAAIESWWRQRAVGDEGRSFGLMQIKRGSHCCLPATRTSTAFNADYYGAWLRHVYDGRARWLNHQRRGERYKRGDLWGSVGVWYAGHWHYNSAEYIRRLKKMIRQRVWRRAHFRYGG
ncbi:MAG TPA: hypothetical protein VD790_08025 [Thermoleophilaceae bacterium]|nr:hypothetical protein [Thermoleophilaceae bacterium]